MPWNQRRASQITVLRYRSVGYCQYTSFERDRCDRIDKEQNVFTSRSINQAYYWRHRQYNKIKELQKEDIKRIIMVACSTKLSCVHSALIRYFGEFVTLKFDVSSKEVVALGTPHSVTSGQRTKECNLRVCLVLFVLHNMVDLQWWVKYQMLQIPEISKRIPCKQILLLLIVIKTNQFFYSNSPSHSPFMIPFDS